MKALKRSFFKPFFSILLLLCGFFSFSLNVDAIRDSTPPPSKQQMNATLGVYVMEVYNLDFSRDSFNAVFWVWWSYPENNYKPYNSIELVNALEEKIEHKFVEKVGDSYRAEAKMMARVSQNWNFVSFPFGKQTLKLSLEDAHMPYSLLKFSPDKMSSGIRTLHIEGWQVTDFRIESRITELASNFGKATPDPETKYSNITAYIDIERDSYPLLMKYFIGLFVAIFLCIIMFFIGVQDLTTRMAAVIAAVFSAMGNKYILDRALPDESQITFSDKIQILTFAVILFSATSSVLTDYLIKNTSKKTSKTVNAILGVFVVLAIFFLLTLFIDQAVNAPPP